MPDAAETAPRALARAAGAPASPWPGFARPGFAWTGLCLCLGALVAAVLVLAPYPPLQDFPEWAYQGHLLARLLRGLPIGEIHLATTPVPNSSVQLLLGLLSLAMPAALAARLFLLGLVGASVAVSLGLGRRCQPAAPGAFAALLLVAVFLNAAFWNGYVNFQLGMVLLGAWFLLPEARRASPWPIMGFGLVIFFTHAMVFFAFCALLGATALLDRRRIIPTAIGLLPAAILTGWYIATDAGGGATETSATGGPAAFLAYKLYTVAKLGPYHNFVFGEGGDIVTRPAVYWAGAAVNLAFAAGLAALLGLGLRAAIRGRRLAWAPLLAAAGLLALFAVLPDLVQNVVNPGERLMLPALLMLLLVLPLPAALVRALGLGAVVLGACLLLLLATDHAWREPVHYTELRAETAGLFRHRPTAFACKWQEMLRSAAAGDLPREPLAFRTSLLIGTTSAGCTGKPG
ncbi:hypothetical protein E2C06_13730 [Dankookia rubra]|uniref:DUF2723 domain-containing protein n=1 Tax=Dankookia rubra TaxID=1442381 RepID=A0A4R5QFI9_9PROT|nr:hypothetical protein [Dankookia rubra]TDH62024.1 hypothetical protein E2C06_13730 [Dankookia rubra]